MNTNLIQLGDDYAETRHICGVHLYNLKTAAARDAFATAMHAQATEVERLRELAATCYAGLGAECNLPEAWLDVLNAAANGESFSVEGLLPFKAPAQPVAPQAGAVPRAWTNVELTEIYNQANGITIKNPPLTTERIFAAMRRMAEIAQGGSHV